MPFKSREIMLARHATGPVEPGNFAVHGVVVDDPGPGQVLVRNTWLSIDPALRLRLSPTSPPGYGAPIPPGAPLVGLAVGEVVASGVDGFRPGDVVTHAQGYREYALVDVGAAPLGGAGGLSHVDVSAAAPEAYLGVLGYPGVTAYAGLREVGRLAAGDVLWVSAAAGAVGSLAAQLGKLWGNNVIGTAGSAEKVAYLRDELGLDAAFSYRDGDLGAALAAAAPDGIDVYFDNVGGDHLAAALNALRVNGRVVMCGAISTYDGAAGGPTDLFPVTAKGLTLRGFRAGAFEHLLASMRAELAGLVAEGRLRLQETIVDGLDAVPEAIVGLLRGANLGKMLARL